nr:hypothetical protein [Treponema endosymbiont of Eucomonympha sp.]
MFYVRPFLPLFYAIQRHVIENVFRALKRWRGIATRYAMLTASFIAAIHVRCLFLYLPVHTT